MPKFRQLAKGCPHALKANLSEAINLVLPSASSCPEKSRKGLFIVCIANDLGESSQGLSK